jgi:hypothetical protein
MNIVKGFVTINQFVNNTPGLISPLGELSTWSRTYSKEKGEYQNPDVPGFKLTTFKSITGNDVETPVTTNLAKQILEVVNDCVIYATSHIRPYNSIDFKNNILTNFYLKVTDLHIGDFVDNGTIALPEWVSWTSADNAGTLVRVWLADLAFQDQYDESTIVVVPPMENIDHFFNAYNIALTELNARTSSQLTDKIQLLKNGHPETYIRLMDFNFINRLDSAQINPSTWGAIIYGKIGDNIDNIKDAMIEYVLSHSVHSKAEWEAILPDLFKRTEFIMMPRWDKVSIPNLTIAANLYSSMLDPRECINFAKAVVDFYDQVYVENNTIIFPFDYKAISLVSVNGITNSGNNRTLNGLFPDYIPVNTSSPDFSRMSLKTRDWMLYLQELLIAAETVTPFTSVPLNVRKQYKGGKLFVSGMYDNVNYLVAARFNDIYQVT